MELKEKMNGLIDNVKDFATDHAEDIMIYSAGALVIWTSVSVGHVIGYSNGYTAGFTDLLNKVYINK